MIIFVLKIMQPRRFYILLIFVIVFLLGFNMNTMLDLTNNMVMYFPIYTIISIPEVVLYGEDEGMKEILFIQTKNKVVAFFRRLAYRILGFAVLSLIIRLLFISFKTIDHKQSISFMIFLGSALLSMLFFASITLLLSVIIRKKSIVYILGFVLWIFWNINNEMLSSLNPFLFVANPVYWTQCIPFQLMIILPILLIACWLNCKTPYYFAEVINKTLGKIYNLRRRHV